MAPASAIPAAIALPDPLRRTRDERDLALQRDLHGQRKLLVASRRRPAGRLARRRRSSKAVTITRTRRMRRPSTSSAMNCQPSCSIESPASGTWPSVLNTKPAIVSQSSSGMSDVEQLVELGDRHPAVDEVLARRQADDIRRLVVVLVDDLADELLEAVLERDQTGDRAVLVGDQREVELAGLHLAHQLAQPACSRARSAPRARAPAPTSRRHRRARRASDPWCRRCRPRRRPSEPSTGSRLYPCSIARSSACDTVASWGIIAMSGRGTITSRTTVSPNSMMLSISSRSSCSITSSAAAAPTMPSSSCSLTNGPCLSPLPGQQHVGQPDQRPRDQPQRRERHEQRWRSRAVASAPARCAAPPTSWASTRRRRRTPRR